MKWCIDCTHFKGEANALEASLYRRHIFQGKKQFCFFEFDCTILSFYPKELLSSSAGEVLTYGRLLNDVLSLEQF